MIVEGVSATGPRVTVRMVRASRGSLSVRMVRASRPCVVPSAEGGRMGSVYLPATSMLLRKLQLSAIMSTHWTDDLKAVCLTLKLSPLPVSPHSWPLLAPRSSPEGLCSCSDTRRLSDLLWLWWAISPCPWRPGPTSQTVASVLNTYSISQQSI